MVSEKGYKRRTYEEILAAKIAKAQELFGEDINTESNTPLGKYIRINAYDQYYVEQIAEQIYYSIFPQTASGQSLDRLGWSVGMSRNIATPARYSVAVTGTAGSVIEYGFLVGSESELQFFNTEEAVIGEDGKCELIVECTEAGAIGNISPQTINVVVSPVDYVDSVVGIGITEAATDEESDFDFLKRYEIMREGRGSCNESSIISALTDIPTVRGAYVVANESATETVNGIPPKTIACYINGGVGYEQQIGEAIFSKKPIGVGTHGNESVLVAYGGLNDYAVKFSFAHNVDVYINLTITTDAEFEASGYETIKQNIVAYINSLGIGEPLITTSLYSYVYSVAGVKTALVEISVNGENYSSDNINIDPYARCSFEQITINGTVI